MKRKNLISKSEIRKFTLKGKALKYCFLRRKGAAGQKCSYGVMIEYDGERSVNGLGECFSEAARLYDALTRGLVTPTTVGDILEDHFSDK